ncbi:MAG: hypothetical protein WC866_00940 [Patescibacteria group bacterium]|jgi:hypothetical protein
MSEELKTFDWECSLNDLVAKNNDHAFAALLDGKTSDEALAVCQKLYQTYVDEHDDVCALRQVEYLLTMQRDLFREAPNADARSVQYGMAEAALTRWRKLPRNKEGRPGCPSTPTLLKTKVYLASIAASVWAARETKAVSAAAILMGLLSLPHFGNAEEKLLLEVVRAVLEHVPHERLCHHAVIVIEMMSRAERGSPSARPHPFLRPMLTTLVRRLVTEYAERPKLQNFAVALRVLSALGESTDSSVGQALEAQAKMLIAKVD